MKIDYEIDMRWAIAEHVWKQIKGQTCFTNSKIAQDSDCAESELWVMYKKECKSGNEAYKMKMEGCTMDSVTFEIELGTFVGTNEKVLAMLKEFDKKLEDLREVFTKDYLDMILEALKEKMIQDSKQIAMTDDQATCIIAHETLMNSEAYQEFIGYYRFWAMAMHYLRVKKYQIYAGIGGGVLLLLILFGGSESGVQQTVVIRRA